jgi:hypothetical protein
VEIGVHLFQLTRLPAQASAIGWFATRSGSDSVA